MTEKPDRIERTLELLLYAPLGIGMFLKETAPEFVDMFVSRGRAEIDRRHDDVQQRVTTARSMGQVALAFGAPKLRRRIERAVADTYHRAEGLLGSPASSPSPPRPAPAPPAPAAAPARPESGRSESGRSGSGRSESGRSESGYEAAAPPPSDLVAAVAPSPAHATTNGDSDASARLPIPGYDALSASQVVERLIGLAPDELTAVHDYESSHRQRRTILGKIEQLAG